MTIFGKLRGLNLISFLATLVAPHLTPVSKRVSKWAEFRTSVATRLASLFKRSLKIMSMQFYGER